MVSLASPVQALRQVSPSVLVSPAAPVVAVAHLQVLEAHLVSLALPVQALRQASPSVLVSPAAPVVAVAQPLVLEAHLVSVASRAQVRHRAVPVYRSEGPQVEGSLLLSPLVVLSPSAEA